MSGTTNAAISADRFTIQNLLAHALGAIHHISMKTARQLRCIGAALAADVIHGMHMMRHVVASWILIR
jgi:hypothetical protein